jgi:hypothetical protein
LKNESKFQRLEEQAFIFSESTNEFKTKYPFVMIHVDQSLRSEFIKECLWLQSKVGYFPDQLQQVEILENISEK